MSKTFVGFGFGAIQGGLFLPEAYRSGNFSRLVISEIDSQAVAQVRSTKGSYAYNVAERDHLSVEKVEGIEIYNPLVPTDRVKLVEAIASASELCTALPSYTLYDVGEASVASLLADGFRQKVDHEDLPSAVVYAAENDARAAARLEQSCLKYLSVSLADRVFFSETVISKMCSVVLEKDRIESENLMEVTAGSQKSFLVEAFNEILIEAKEPAGFERGISQFITKPDLDPFALTKFHGHNAVHYGLGLKAKGQGLKFMHQVREFPDLINWARDMFVQEAGPGLIAKFASFEDDLFTEKGFAAYAEDALHRMVNPYLRDPIDRVTRDPQRKLGWDDRLIGSIRLAMKVGITPKKMIDVFQKGLLDYMHAEQLNHPKEVLDRLWADSTSDQKGELREAVLSRFG